MKKKTILTIISMTLIFLLPLSTPMRAFAATEKQYISELKINTGSDSYATKQWLDDKGYKVINGDLNKGATKQYVYLGYKTTTDPNQAVTDMSVMDMKGGYSFGDYKQMLEQQYKSFESYTNRLMVIVNEFRERYKEGSPAAISAYESLNNLVEDDSNKGVGEFLLDVNTPFEDILKMVTQASQIMMGSVVNLLGVGIANYNSNSVAKKLSDLGPVSLDDITYYDDFELMKENIDTFISQLKNYINVKDTINLEDIESYSFLQIATAYDVLSTYKYGNGTLINLFTKEDYKPSDFYPLISVMTQGQRKVAAAGSLDAVLSTAVTSSTWNTAESDVTVDSEIKKQSVYYGVDRSMFKDGVASTSDALRQMAQTGDTSPLYGNIAKNTEIALIATAATTATIGIAAIATAKIVKSTLTKLSRIVSLNLGRMADAGGGIIIQSADKIGRTALAKGQAIMKFFPAKFLAGLQIAGFVALAVSLIITAVFMGLELWNYYHPEYTEIPKILLDTAVINGQREYIRYDCVTDKEGKMADLNAWGAKQWNALYYTKDKKAGDPILAYTLCKAGTASEMNEAEAKIPANYYPVHYFGQTAKFNLNTHCFSSSAPEIYLYLRHNPTVYATTTGSMFGQPTVSILTGIGGLLIGFGCGCGAIILTRKRKNEETSEVNTSN